jgi:XTP/dITP diphosphohydrolase
MKKLLIATNNPGKLIELGALLGDLNLELIHPAMLGLEIEVEEDGSSYSENAFKKATVFCQKSNLPTLADDSGLEVDELGGAPGLHSRRYAAGTAVTDADRRVVLIRALSGKPRPWVARFRAAIAVAKPGGQTSLAEGVCPGEIIPEERGTGGFGYDPIFLVENTGKTMAELNLEDKNRVSHRARAVAELIPGLVEFLNS